MKRKLLAVWAFFKRRVQERSFWTDVGAAFVSAAALPKPWSYWVAAALVFKSLIPDAVKPAA